MDVISRYKLAKARNPALGLNLVRKVTVPRGVKKIYIPRTKHYSPDILGEENVRLEAFYDLLEPCIVERKGYGWGFFHECPYHKIYIEEKTR